MHALETRSVVKPTPGRINPFHPQTHQSLDDLDVLSLPEDETRDSGRSKNWRATGFIIGGDQKFIGTLLKERFFHNPLVGYTFRASDGMVVEYEYQSSTR